MDVSWEWIREFEQALEEAPNEQEQSTVTTAIRFQQDFLNQTLSFNVIAFQFGNLVHLVHPSELDSITIGLMV